MSTNRKQASENQVKAKIKEASAKLEEARHMMVYEDPNEDFTALDIHAVAQAQFDVGLLVERAFGVVRKKGKR